MAAGFLYLTSVAKWDVGRVLRPIQTAGRVWSEPANAATTYAPDEQNNIDVYKAARDATVNITSTVYTRDFFLQVIPQKGTGTGFIINPDGQILTNFHVVNENPRELSVTLSDKKVYRATVKVYDAKNDLALVKIDAPGKLPTLHLGDSDNLLVGQKVLAIGNPFQFEGTLTTGIVSSVGRDIETEERRLEGMIQTDAAINPGNSGGPLLDSHGNVIGINTAIYGQQGSVGIGFAMPIARAKAMLRQYESNGDISPAAPIGITSIYVAGDVAEMLRLPTKGGLLVESVERGTAADTAGLRGPDSMVRVGNYRVGVGGDLIMAVDGRPIDSNQTLQRVLNEKHGGDTLELTVYRKDHSEKVRLKLGKAPQKL
jgi:S1-C subfamily serine protease